MTIIMPVFLINEELLQLTQQAVESFGDVPLVIIDNGSTVGGGYLRSIAHTYVRNPQNLGYARAVNQGLKLVEDDFITIANNDIRVSPNWKAVAMSVFEEPGTYSCHFRMTDYDEPFRYGKETIYTGKERWCTASFFVVKNPLVYDEHFLNSYDDWDYFMTARKMGLRTAYTDRACYQHKHSSTQQLLPSREEQNQRNREYFKKKWGEYPEDLFAQEFPEQMKKEYWGGFQI